MLNKNIAFITITRTLCCSVDGHILTLSIKCASHFRYFFE